MRRVLLTGMSGTGKSTVIDELVARGFRAIDADEGWSQSGPEGDWVWIEDRIQRPCLTNLPMTCSSAAAHPTREDSIRRSATSSCSARPSI
jgi:hypothetical protein